MYTYTRSRGTRICPANRFNDSRRNTTKKRGRLYSRFRDRGFACFLLDISPRLGTHSKTLGRFESRNRSAARRHLARSARHYAGSARRLDFRIRFTWIVRNRDATTTTRRRAKRATTRHGERKRDREGSAASAAKSTASVARENRRRPGGDRESMKKARARDPNRAAPGEGARALTLPPKHTDPTATWSAESAKGVRERESARGPRLASPRVFTRTGRATAADRRAR